MENYENPYKIKVKPLTGWNVTAKKVISFNRVAYLMYNGFAQVAILILKNRNNKKELYRASVDNICAHKVEEIPQMGIACFTQLLNKMRKDLNLRENEIL